LADGPPPIDLLLAIAILLQGMKQAALLIKRKRKHGFVERVPFHDPTVLLSRQLMHDISQILTDLAENRLLPVLWDEYDMKLTFPTTMT